MQHGFIENEISINSSGGTEQNHAAVLNYPFSIKYLKTILDYNPETGKFIWYINREPNKCKGKIAGCLKDGYIKIKINQISYYAHQLAWFYMTEEWPIQIDHKNTIKNDNRFNNLRICSNVQSSANTKKHKKNKTGYKGVCLETRTGKFYASITHKNIKYHLGTFLTAEEAHLCYKKKTIELNDEFARY